MLFPATSLFLVLVWRNHCDDAFYTQKLFMRNQNFLFVIFWWWLHFISGNLTTQFSSRWMFMENVLEKVENRKIRILKILHYLRLLSERIFNRTQCCNLKFKILEHEEAPKDNNYLWIIFLSCSWDGLKKTWRYTKSFNFQENFEL